MSQRPKLIANSPLTKHQLPLVEKVGTFGAIFAMNLALFLFLGSYVVYRAVVAEQPQPLVFVKVKPTPPPAKPPAAGGEAARSLADPDTVVVPPTVAPPSLVVSNIPSSINFKASVSRISAPIGIPSFEAPRGVGMGSGAGGGGHSASNPFGDGLQSGVPGLVGELYDLKQNADGTPSAAAIVPPETLDYYPTFLTLPATQEGLRILRAYVKNWDQSILDQYYKAPVLLQTSQIFIPTRPSEEATKAFGVADKVVARRWVIHYHGTIVPPTSGKFRFMGFGDDFLVVRVGNQNVLDGSERGEELDKTANGIDEKIAGPPRHNLGCGKWFNFDAGSPTPIDVLIGEGPGGTSGFVLLIQEQGDNSAKGDYPVFQIAATPLAPWKNYSPAFTGKTMVFPAQ